VIRTGAILAGVIVVIAACGGRDDLAACRSGDAVACRRRALALRRANPGAGIALLTTACDRGDARSCQSLAHALADAPPPIGDLTRAEQLFRTGCLAFDRTACAFRALLCEEHRLVACAIAVPEVPLEAPGDLAPVR
jgi:hypothetical protein